MNNLRRKNLQKAVELLEEAKSIIDEAQFEEREYYENMPEALQNSERGETADEVASNLAEGVDTLDELIETLNNAIS
jgi:hypothetical protein